MIWPRTHVTLTESPANIPHANGHVAAMRSKLIRGTRLQLKSVLMQQVLKFESAGDFAFFTW